VAFCAFNSLSWLVLSAGALPQANGSSRAKNMTVGWNIFLIFMEKTASGNARKSEKMLE
jgi:hypothetical protein